MTTILAIARGHNGSTTLLNDGEVVFYLEEERLSRFPKKQKHKIIILRNILSRFSVKDIYTEKEINKILNTAHEDHVTLRRYLIE